MWKKRILSPSEFFDFLQIKVGKDGFLALFVAFIVGMINNLNFIITEGVAPDVLVLDVFRKADTWEISLGRYGIAFMDELRGGFINKAVIIVISLIFLSLAVLLLIKTFKIKSKILILLLAGIVSAAPQFTETFMFIYCADSYCLAFLLSTLFVYSLNKAGINKRFYLLAILCIVGSCSIYQAYLGVCIGLSIVLFISKILKNENIKKICIEGIISIAVLVIGVFLYYGILKIILKVNGVELASYKGANKLGLDTILALPKTVLQCYKDFINYYFGNRVIYNNYWKRRYINLGIYVLLFLSLFFINIKNDKKIVRFVLIFMLLALMPVGVNIMNIIAPGTKANLVTGSGLLLMYLIFVIFQELLDEKKSQILIQYCSCFLVLCLIGSFFLSNNATYQVREYTHRNYYTNMMSILTRAQSLDKYDKNMKWMFSDIIVYHPANLDKTNGFISMDMELRNRLGDNQNFFERYLGMNINMVDNAKYTEIESSEEFQQMPYYPKEGSIAIIDNVVVVKIKQ